MKTLLYFLIRNSHWLLTTLLVVFSFYLVFSHNAYQRSVFLSSANVVVGNIYTATNHATAFLQLRGDNIRLMERNVQLEKELHTMREYLGQILAMDISEVKAFVRDSLDDETLRFGFIPAEVTNMTFAGPNNFITLNKGTAHGVGAGMGVISQTGIVGVVATASQHFSVVLPVINPRFRLSARLKNSENFGSISWNGENAHQAQLTELPRHEIFSRGDTVLTSFSRIFPQNLIIGFVSEQGQSIDDNFNTFNIRLATDFYTLQNVFVIDDRLFREQNELEQSFLR